MGRSLMTKLKKEVHTADWNENMGEQNKSFEADSHK
jgi:hypothetical protein